MAFVSLSRSRGMEIVAFVSCIGIGLCLTACRRSPNDSLPGGERPNELVVWSRGGASGDEMPGISRMSVYHLGSVFAVWSDSGAGGHAASSSNVHGVQCEGHLLARDGRRIAFRCSSADGEAGSVEINDAEYVLEHGPLFLVSCEGDEVRVQQLKRDLATIEFKGERLSAYAEEDPDFRAFFSGAK